MRLRALVIVAVLGSGCGYRVRAPNSQLPAGVSRLSVPMFVNRTSEPGAELTFTSAARALLQRAGTLGGANAEAELVGVIAGVSSGPVQAAPDLPPVFRLSVVLELQVTQAGRTVAATTVTWNEEFPSGADVLLSEANRSSALVRLAEAAVQEGLERLFAPTP